MSHKVGKSAIAAALVVTMLLGGPALAFADSAATAPLDTPQTEEAAAVVPYKNNKDTGFDFRISTNNTGATGYRRKDDTSSVYVNITSRSGAGMRMYVDGATNNTGANSMDCTQGVYRSSKTGEFFMYNLVRENGRGYARLTAWADRGSGVVSGVWSPDSVGSYPLMPSD